MEAEHGDVRPAAASDRLAVRDAADRVRGVFQDPESESSARAPGSLPARSAARRNARAPRPSAAGPSRSREDQFFLQRPDMLRFQVTGSMSTKSTSAPQYRAQFADATNVLGTVQSESPLPRPSARQAMCSAEVALLTATACAAPVRAPRPPRTAGSAGPCVRKSERRTAETASTSACVMSWRPYGITARRPRRSCATISSIARKCGFLPEWYSKPCSTGLPCSRRSD